MVSPRGRAARSTRATGPKEAQSERQQQRKMRRREKARLRQHLRLGGPPTYGIRLGCADLLLGSFSHRHSAPGQRAMEVHASVANIMWGTAQRR